MAKYFRVTVTSQLISTFKVVYSTESSPTIFNHTAEIYDESNNSYSTATGLTYGQLTDNGGAIVRTDDDVYQIKIEDENNYCTDCVSNAFGIPAPGILLETITPSGTGTTYQNVNGSLTAYAGESRRLLFEYTSDDGPYGDFQISNIYFASNSSLDNYDSRNNNNFQTSRDQESQYSNVTWYTIDGGSTGGRWVMGGGSTPSSGTGINTDNYKSTYQFQSPILSTTYAYSTTNVITVGYYTTTTTLYFNPKYYFYYAETSDEFDGYPNKKFWLRSPIKTIPATGGYYSFDYGGFGSDMGVLKVWLV